MYNAGNIRSPDGSFRSYDTPEQGYMALLNDLTAKVSGNSPAMRSKLGNDYTPTLTNLISVYAPPSENNTSNYIDFVSKQTGLNPNQPLTREDVKKIAPAIVTMEQGQQGANIYKQYADAGTFQSDASPEAPQTFNVRLPNGQLLQNIPVGTTKEQIRQKLAAKGITFDEQPAQPAQEQPQVGLGRTALEQGLQGATFGFADEVTDRIGAGIATLATGESYDKLLEEARGNTTQRLNAEFSQHPVTSIAANIAGGLLTGGAAGTTKAGTALTNSLRSGNLPLRIAKGAAAGLSSGALYGLGAGEDGKRLENAQNTATVGAILGGSAPAVSAGIKSVISPAVSEGIKTLASRAKDLGIPLSLDQIAPSKVRNTVQKISQNLPFSGVDNFQQAQRTAWNRAVAKTIGQDADALTPEVVQNYLADASQKFDSVLKGNNISLKSTDINTFDNIANSAKNNITKEYYNIVQGKVNAIKNELFKTQTASNLEIGHDLGFVTKTTKQIIPNEISGEKLASLRSSLIADLPKVSSGAKEYVSDLIDGIDRIAQRSLTGEQQKILNKARLEWRNFKTIEPLLEKSPNGDINPTQLMQRVASSKFIKASRTDIGKDDLVDLAKIGKQFMPIKGGSDTAEKVLLGGGTLANLGLLVGAPQVAIPALAAQGGAVGANRAYQSFVNQSPKAVSRILSEKTPVLSKYAVPATVLEGNVSQHLKK